MISQELQGSSFYWSLFLCIFECCYDKPPFLKQKLRKKEKGTGPKASVSKWWSRCLNPGPAVPCSLCMGSFPAGRSVNSKHPRRILSRRTRGQWGKKERDENFYKEKLTKQTNQNKCLGPEVNQKHVTTG